MEEGFHLKEGRGSSQDLPSEARREQGKVRLVLKNSLVFLHNLIKLPELFPNLLPSFSGSDAIEVDNQSPGGRTEVASSRMCQTLTDSD